MGLSRHAVSPGAAAPSSAGRRALALVAALLLPALIASAALTRAAAPQSQREVFLPIVHRWLAPPGDGADYVRFAVIGDYGDGSDNERAVAELVKRLAPSFIITTGDNNYPDGAAETIDDNVGQFYSDYIHPYRGRYGSGADTNRFFPSLGNHDWRAPGAAPYLGYFTLPGNERYYDIVRGPVHLFALDSDVHEPDGATSGSVQAGWLAGALAGSTACWQLVYFHHPPYSSGRHGSDEDMRWPFREWGADAVVAGHDHLYERLSVDGIPYFVNGLGGNSIYDFGKPLPESVVRYNGSYGAMLVEATRAAITYQFIAVDGTVADSYTQAGGCA
jgi:hypothetical protein